MTIHHLHVNENTSILVKDHVISVVFISYRNRVYRIQILDVSNYVVPITPLYELNCQQALHVVIRVDKLLVYDYMCVSIKSKVIPIICLKLMLQFNC